MVRARTRRHAQISHLLDDGKHNQERQSSFGVAASGEGGATCADVAAGAGSSFGGVGAAAGATGSGVSWLAGAGRGVARAVAYFSRIRFCNSPRSAVVMRGCCSSTRWGNCSDTAVSVKLRTKAANDPFDWRSSMSGFARMLRASACASRSPTPPANLIEVLACNESSACDDNCARN